MIREWYTAKGFGVPRLDGVAAGAEFTPLLIGSPEEDVVQRTGQFGIRGKTSGDQLQTQILVPRSKELFLVWIKVKVTMQIN